MSMPTRRRLAAAVTLAATLSGLSIAGSGSAHAEVLNPLSMGSAQVDFEKGSGCTLTGPGNAVEVSDPFKADGAVVTYGASSSATITKNSNPADVTTVSASTTRTVTITQAGGQLSRLVVRDSFTAQTASALGAAQECDARALAGGMSVIGFDLVKPTYVTVKSLSQGMSGQLLVTSGSSLGLNNSEDDFVEAVSGGLYGTGVGTALLPAGNYTAVVMSYGLLQANGGAASGEVTIEVTFDEPGIATTTTIGKGKKYVALPEADNCATNTAVVTWSKKAGTKKSPKIKKAVFKVDGVKVGQAKGKKATKGKTTTLKNLPAESAFTIEGTITLRSGQKVTVERAYQACS